MQTSQHSVPGRGVLAVMTDSKKGPRLPRVSSPRLLTRAGLGAVSGAGLFLPQDSAVSREEVRGTLGGPESRAQSHWNVAEGWGPTSLWNLKPPSLWVHKSPGKVRDPDDWSPSHRYEKRHRSR